METKIQAPIAFDSVKNWNDFLTFCGQNGFDYAEDSDGQLVIYTGKRLTGNNTIEDFSVDYSLDNND